MSIHKTSYKKIKRVMHLLGVVVVFIMFYIILKPYLPTITIFTFPQVKDKILFEKHAQKIVDVCAINSYRPACYDKEIPKLMDKPSNLTMEETFEVTKIIQKKDQSYAYCHGLGHFLSAKEVKKNPAAWKEAVARCPDGVCANGCLHGGLMERFKKEYLSEKHIKVLIVELENVCAKRPGWNPTISQQAICIHGLGHLLMYATKADIDKSIKICNLLTSKYKNDDFSKSCLNGIFMQLFLKSDPDEIALTKDIVPIKKDVSTFCDQFTLKIKSECVIESWPMFKDQIMTPSGLMKFCSFTQDQAERKRCYHKIVGIITIELFKLNHQNTEIIGQFCSSLPLFDNEYIQCYATAAMKLVQIDIENGIKSSHVCQQAKEEETKIYCFNALIQYGKRLTHPNSSSLLNYCNKFPDPWNIKCLRP